MTMELSELKELLEQRPSIFRSMVAMQTVKLVAFLVMWVSWLLVGYFFFKWFFIFESFESFDSKELTDYKLKYRESLLYLFLSFLLLAGSMAYIRNLARKILLRNSYQLELEECIEKTLSSSLKTPSK